MSLDRCSSCCGRKKIMGMGGIVKECPVCAGIGFIKVKETAKSKASDYNDSPIKIKKKPGRKPKIKIGDIVTEPLMF